jgi:hypothetical protein
VVGDDTEEWDDTQSVIIRYSNPGGTDLPNAISFRFPCMSDGNPLFPAGLACLHASLAEPVCYGLYFEGGDIKYDSLEDWSRFWPPIIRACSCQGHGKSTASLGPDNIN